MERFCEEQLWNTSLLVDNTWPQFTDCFRHTVLIWLPCAFLFLMLPYYVTSVRQRATDIEFKITALFGARLCCCITLTVLSFLHLAMRTRALTISTSPAAYLGDALYILSYTTLCLMTQFERLKGVHTSTIPFFFWLLTSLCNIIHLYTMVILKLYAYYTVSFTVFLLTYSLQLCSLALTAFVNNRGNERGKKGQRLCPETTCSFPSYLTFWWMTRLVVTGFGRDLEEGDLWQLPAGERSANLADRFNRMWAEEQRVCQQANRKEQCRATNASQSTKESTHLLDNGSPPDHHKEEEEGRWRPRLMRTLVRMMAGDFCVIFLQKAVSDFLYLCTPLLLGAMMRYLSLRETGREWQGYVLCLYAFNTSLAHGVDQVAYECSGNFIPFLLEPVQQLTQIGMKRVMLLPSQSLRQNAVVPEQRLVRSAHHDASTLGCDHQQVPSKSGTHL
ncbi:ATP-binding cassette sub-family C member 3-like [Littorina saxatilis]|uniref:ATP-binding cassette sub-family C member 3-like n=1 Tax=Littorina saxatilis TaxID=31220 RepID=UPI0038B4ABC9